MRIVFKIWSILPLWLAHGVGWIAGWIAFFASGVYRKRFLENVRQAGMGGRQWMGAVGESGKMAAELPRLWLGKPVQVQLEGAEHVETALDRKRGVLFLTPHLGCFEVIAHAYSQRWGQVREPMTVLYRPPRQPWLRDLAATARVRPGIKVAPTNLAGVKLMIKALKGGQVLGLLPDQVPPQGMGLWAPFFGRDAYTMTLSARLVQQTGAELMLVWGERLSLGRGYRVHFEPFPGELPQDGAQAVLAINQAMEGLIRRCPQQYLWGYARYKQPRQDA